MGVLCWVVVAAQTSLIVMCGLSCSAACGIVVPQPGTQPMSPALKGGFFSTESPGKFWSYLFLDQPLNPLCSLQLLQLSWKCNYLKVWLLDRVWGWWWRRAGVSSWRSRVSCVKMKEQYSKHWGGPLCFPDSGESVSFVCFWHVDGPFRNRHHLCLLAQLLQTCLTSTLWAVPPHPPPGSSIHGIFQERILEWVAISSSRGSSSPRNQTHSCYVSCIGRSSLPLVPPGKPHHSYWPPGYFTDRNPSSG